MFVLKLTLVISAKTTPSPTSGPKGRVHHHHGHALEKEHRSSSDSMMDRVGALDANALAGTVASTTTTTTTGKAVPRHKAGDLGSEIRARPDGTG